MRFSRLLLAVIMGALTVLVAAAPAAAHNSLTSSDPKNGARLDRAPSEVRLTFLSRLDPATTKVTVTGPDNVPALAGAPRFDRARVAVPVKAGAAGLYIVAYEVASGDGHPVTGEVRFTLTVAATPAASPTPSASAAQATPSTAVAPSLTPAAEDEDARGGGATWWPWIVGGGLLLLALGGFVLARRRRAAS
ncbi:copper resistance CopC family protein [Micromonospora sp. NPDC049679]|uniref:copper resistance CopC family protein n=1 Tax=Micromonospora sp. NPDC049679 TaxID=3155920 RepID=UPI0033D2C77F